MKLDKRTSLSLSNDLAYFPLFIPVQHNITSLTLNLSKLMCWLNTFQTNRRYSMQGARSQGLYNKTFLHGNQYFRIACKLACLSLPATSIYDRKIGLKIQKMSSCQLQYEPIFVDEKTVKVSLRKCYKQQRLLMFNVPG